MLLAANRLGEAEPLLRRAREIYEATLGIDDPKSVLCRKSLALLELLRQNGDTRAAG